MSKIVKPALEIKGVTHVIHDDELNEVQAILDGDTPVYLAGNITFTANFDNDFTIDVNVILVQDDDCSGNSYIEATLYHGHHEIETETDPMERLDDEDFVFVYNDVTYIFTIMRASTYDEIMREKSYQ